MRVLCAPRELWLLALRSVAGAFGFERGRSKLERGHSATVYRFGENPENVLICDVTCLCTCPDCESYSLQSLTSCIPIPHT